MHDRILLEFVISEHVSTHAATPNVATTLTECFSRLASRQSICEVFV